MGTIPGVLIRTFKRPKQVPEAMAILKTTDRETKVANVNNHNCKYREIDNNNNIIPKS